MVRKALLIGGHDIGRNAPSNGVVADLVAWRRFLTSPIGGNWHDNEIDEITSGDRLEVLANLFLCCHSDYTLVAFSGHGELVRDKHGFPETIISLHDGEEMSERQLNTGADRCMTVLDCCRRYPPTEKIAMNSLNESVKWANYLDTRAKYERLLNQSEKGYVRVYGAGEDRAAADEYSFTRAMIDAAKESIGGYADGVIPINEAVRLAKSKLPPQQSPVYNGGRRIGHFPFAVNSLSRNR